MNKFLLFLLIAIFSVSTSFALDPIRVAVPTDINGNAQVSVELIELGTGTVLTQNIGTVTPDLSSVFSFIVGEGNGTWATLSPANVNSNHVLNITIASVLRAQLRLDRLIARQALFGQYIDGDELDPAIEVNTTGTITSTIDGGSGLTISQTPSIKGDNDDEVGVLGLSNSGVGVYGKSNLINSFAVYGQSTSGIGVNGTSVSSSGVRGFSTSGIGVYGTSTTADAVQGVSNSGNGLRGQSNSKHGVFGSSNSGYGIWGTSITSNSAYFNNSNPGNSSQTVLITTNGTGVALEVNAGSGLAIDVNNGGVNISENSAGASLAINNTFFTGKAIEVAAGGGRIILSYDSGDPSGIVPPDVSVYQAVTPVATLPPTADNGQILWIVNASGGNLTVGQIFPIPLNQVPPFAVRGYVFSNGWYEMQ